MRGANNYRLQSFAEDHKLLGLTDPSLEALVAGEKGYTVVKAQRFLAFQQRIDSELLHHRVITRNPYTSWFKRGEQTAEQVQAFVVQFSVFSNLFLVAQLYKTINADSLEGMRASKEILANEIGVVFHSPAATAAKTKDPSRSTDPALISTEGSVEGGIFRFKAAHFEWLLRLAEKLALGFNDVGKRRHGTEATLFFCDELRRLYGNEDYTISQAASYAVENWAAAGFWDELVAGFTHYNTREDANLPLAFFTWHSRLEAQHAQHTQEELEELYFGRQLDEDAFIQHGNLVVEKSGLHS